MSPYEPATWSWWTWVLLAIGAYYLVGFFQHFFRFRRRERAAAQGDPVAIAAFNRSLRGFPHAGYAKMLGKRPLVADAGRDTGPEGRGTGKWPLVADADQEAGRRSGKSGSAQGALGARQNSVDEEE